MKENREERQRPRKPQEKARRLPGQDAYEWVQALVCSVLTVVMIFTFAVRLIGPVDTRYVVGRAVAMVLPGPDSVTGEREFSRIGLLH